MSSGGLENQGTVENILYCCILNIFYIVVTLLTYFTVDVINGFFEFSQI